jgi:hypothetical protein
MRVDPASKGNHRSHAGQNALHEDPSPPAQDGRCPHRAFRPPFPLPLPLGPNDGRTRGVAYFL